jgi:GTP pyrophosphokinase
MEIGNKIRERRREEGLTQQGLAEKLDVTFQTVSSWERNETLPDVDKLESIADALHIPLSGLLSDNAVIPADRWQLHDRMFSEQHMYTFVKAAAVSLNMVQTLKALPFMKKCHKDQVRKGPEHIPYIYHPLMMACHALALGIHEDTILASALLHDVCEDCGIAPDELPMSEEIRKTVELLTKDPVNDDDKYYKAISENREATVVKVLDRCNNISTMAGAFSALKIAEYIDETEKYTLPLLNKMKTDYPEFYDAAFLIKYQMLTVLDSMKRMLVLNNQ